MKTYYQVCSKFAFIQGKTALVGLSLHSTSVYYPFLVHSYSSPLSHSRYFHTVKEANNYIDYLFSRFPTSKAVRPVLDALQKTLF